MAQAQRQQLVYAKAIRLTLSWLKNE